MPKVISPYIKSQIAALSKHKTLTQADIARAFGVSRVTVRACLTGKKQPRKKIAKQPKDIWDVCPITGFSL